MDVDLIQYFIQTRLPSLLSTHFPYTQSTPFLPKALLTHPSVIQKSHVGATWEEWGEGIHTQSKADIRDVTIPVRASLSASTQDRPPLGLSAFRPPTQQAPSALGPNWNIWSFQL